MFLSLILSLVFFVDSFQLQMLGKPKSNQLLIFKDYFLSAYKSSTIKMSYSEEHLFTLFTLRFDTYMTLLFICSSNFNLKQTRCVKILYIQLFSFESPEKDFSHTIISKIFIVRSQVTTQFRVLKLDHTATSYGLRVLFIKVTERLYLKP